MGSDMMDNGNKLVFQRQTDHTNSTMVKSAPDDRPLTSDCIALHSAVVHPPKTALKLLIWFDKVFPLSAKESDNVVMAVKLVFNDWVAKIMKKNPS